MDPTGSTTEACAFVREVHVVRGLHTEYPTCGKPATHRVTQTMQGGTPYTEYQCAFHAACTKRRKWSGTTEVDRVE